jgi:uncharacterized protein YbjT (DUF2867 family)
MADREFQILGASGLVGHALLKRLADEPVKVIAWSRTPPPGRGAANVVWQVTDPAARPALARGSTCISLIPIRALPDYFPLLETAGLRRVVAVSSTSRYSKVSSSDPGERAVAAGIGECEAALEAWAGRHGIEWVILRPTLIYGNGNDKNICEIARLISRFGFFPLIGGARGRRQPVHADDVADACLRACEVPQAANHSYELSGAEILTYRDMVNRVFTALGKDSRFVSCPIWIFRLALGALKLLPRYRDWSIAMVERMNQDMVFDHADAARDLEFDPRPFRLERKDLPR